jgi:hypothetical protein
LNDAPANSSPQCDRYITLPLNNDICHGVYTKQITFHNMALPPTPFNHVITDYEFLGDINNGAQDCNIWHIGAVKPDGSTFEVFITVDTNRETHAGCVEVTDAYLRKRHAVPFREGFARFVRWVGPQAIIISHNCFKSDKPVLEQECKRHNICMPCWYFYDSLLFLRSAVQSLSYRLPDLYAQITGKVFRQTHTALKDALGLKEILDLVPIHGLYMYPKYLTPLQNIKWAGIACEEAFVKAGVRSVEHLLLKYMQWVQMEGCEITLMKQFLSNMCLPCQDLTPIATELVQHWLPVTHGGLSSNCLF